MKVQYFTFVLNPTEQKPLFQAAKTKEQIFRETLSQLTEPLKFEARSVDLALLKKKEVEDYGIFFIGKHETLDIILPPEQKFDKKEIQNWPYCHVIFDFDSSKKGHKIAFEYKAEVFREPHVQLEALAKALNVHLFASGYAVEFNAVTTERQFWDTIKENENKIKKLILSFNSPNFLKLNNSLSNELKEIEKEYGATKTTITLENPEGKLKVPETELIKQGADYITKGQGSYQLQIKSQKSYIKDKDNIETKEVIDLNIETNDNKVIKQILDKIFNK